MATPSDENATDKSTDMTKTTTQETQSETARSIGGNGGERSEEDTMSDSGAVASGGKDVLVDNGAANDSVQGNGNARKKTGAKVGYDAISTDSYDDEGKLKWRQCEGKFGYLARELTIVPT